ncbi:hypothetical protein ABZU76_24630 [Amycolatopsis sp. NPDC005232]|uniref:hypothetical protein n=1 Tax=Amycolatopsis sp. NPDC005232 TaxID=3157027 RepID=UPI0033B1B88F
MIELLGLLLVIQGAGGLINRLAGCTNPSWFVQLHLLPPQLHIAASAVLLAVGAGVLFAGQARKRRRDHL